MQKSRIRTLKLSLGGDERTAFEVREGDVITIGRDPGCTIQVAHHTVSPVHCRVEYRGESFIMVDLDSSAGVIFRGKRYRHLQLGGRMEVRIGDITVVCEEGSAAAGVVFAPFPRKILAPPVPAQGALRRRAARRVSAGAETLRRAVGLLRRSPAIVASMAVHLMAFAILADMPYMRFATYLTDKIQVRVASPEDLTFIEEELPQKELEFDDPEEPLDDVPDLFEEEILADEEPIDEAPRILELDPGIIGLGGGRDFGWARSLRIGRSSGLSAAERELIDSLRQSGVDIAFVMDTTSSMEGFIAQAKAAVDRLISGLVTIVPNLRLAIVAYRDLGDEYVTQALEFTNDRFQILNFLESLQTMGGGDRDEAVFDGLNRAASYLLWRPNARKVILLIGDSGYHKDSEREIDRLLDDFKKAGGVMHAVYVAGDDADAAPDTAVLEVYCRLAQAAGGICVHLAEYEKLFPVFLNLPFAGGAGFDAAALVENAKITRATQFIERRARNGDRAWLLAQLKAPPVHPQLVYELLKDSSREELLVLVGYLASDRVPVGTKHAAYYILRKTLKRSFRYDPLVPAADQQACLDHIRRMAAAFPDQPPRPQPPAAPGDIPPDNSKRATMEER